jgi:transposase
MFLKIFEGIVEIDEKYLERGSYICSDDFSSYNRLATRGYIHKVVRHRKKEYVDKNNKTNHINGLEGFFSFLKRQLASKGGIRREKLPLYFA